ncbi:MAG: triphosphoribosyl-dephospho-CoA synthase [Hyphomicrobiaceae bacterium]|nr:triphosphoribosyl-dephospho-CoA synthase [Hyphomicrobiaceae bacterium]
MTDTDTDVDAAIADAFRAACRAELEALKPGNVSFSAAGHGMEAAHFIAAADAAAPHVVDRDKGVGQRILAAVSASLAATQCNTNLGIILLCVPLAAAAQQPVPAAPHGLGRASALEARLAAVLEALDQGDAEAVFRAIQHANPGGLGAAATADVREPASIGLRDAMALAADRDRIARAYVTGFSDLFDIALPALKAARAIAETPELAITTLHMCLLASFPDTHIARKHGAATADAVMHEALSHRALWLPVVRPETLDPLARLDASLKARQINPGTTADLVVATLFAERLDLPFAGTPPPFEACLK